LRERLQKVVLSRELELAAQLYFPGGRYLTVFILFAAWSASSGVISTVIRDCTAPLALTANDKAAASTFSWPGPVARLTPQSKRTGLEEKWFALTGRVVGIKSETDGDLHIALVGATGDKPGIVVCEVPAKPQWCEIRNTVFSWTRTKFPFSH
jgi:hypothetical protein